MYEIKVASNKKDIYVWCFNDKMTRYILDSIRYTQKDKHFKTWNSIQNKFIENRSNPRFNIGVVRLF